MIDAERLQEKAEKNGDHLKELIKRSNQQRRDIREALVECERLKQDLKQEPISPEQPR